MSILDRSALIRSRLRFTRLTDSIRAILDTIREPFVVLDGTLRIRLVNKSFCRTFHLSPREINGSRIDSLGDGAWKDAALRHWLETVLNKRSNIADYEMSGCFPAIGQRTLSFNARRVEIKGAPKRIILVTIDDITVRREAERQMQTLNKSLKSDSMTDELTGLFNRRAYGALSQHYLDLAHRRGKKIFVIYADLDGLKKINDEAGHAEGDKVLIRTAEILRKTFRKSDIIARIGGDEFAIAAMENGHSSATTQMARLLANLKRHAEKNQCGQPIALSIGAAHSDLRGSVSIQDLTTQADARMYIEKRAKHRPEMDVPEQVMSVG